MKYFGEDGHGHYRPMFIADCDMWDEMFKELFGDDQEWDIGNGYIKLYQKLKENN